MNEITILTTLAVVHFVALMSPGPDFALVVQNATRYGRQTGLYIALGLSCGILLHSILSLTGISYLVHQQPTLFALLQLAGGSYLFYLAMAPLKRAGQVCVTRKQTKAPLQSSQACSSATNAKLFRAALQPTSLTQKHWCFLSALCRALYQPACH